MLVPWWPLFWFTVACAAVGIVLGWWLFSHRSSQRPAVNEGE